MSFRLNINTDAVVKHTARLERIRKSALPTAVRNTLNKAAFDVKTVTMPDAAKKTFVHRAPNFFKANSKVEKAVGSDITRMQSIVGFVSKGGNDQAVEDLQQQESGGVIKGRALIALRHARAGSSWKRKVSAKNRMNAVKGRIIDAGAAKGKSEKERFIKSAIHAGKGGYVMSEGKNASGNKIVFMVRSVKRLKKGITVAKTVPVFAARRGRGVNPAATHFMQKASLKSAEMMEEVFIKESKRLIEKA